MYYSPESTNLIATDAVSTGFVDPFNDEITRNMPTTMRSVLYLAEKIWMLNGTYRAALRRKTNYFLTDMEISSKVDDDQRQKCLQLFNGGLNALVKLSDVLDDYNCYGNALCSCLITFDRYLVSPFGTGVYRLKEMWHRPEFDVAFIDYEFHANCPRTGRRGVWRVKDIPREGADGLILRRWSPHQIEMVVHPVTLEIEYYWKIPPDVKRALTIEKTLFHLESTPMSVIRAVRDGKMFKFKPGAIYHMKDDVIAGIRNAGWGIPRSFYNFRQICYVEVLRRFNEVIAKDYLVPFRLITPAAPTSSSTDPLATMDLGQFSNSVRRMLADRRRDPATWHTLSMPVNFQTLGVDSSQLTTPDLLNQGMETLLNEADIPVDFYRGTLSQQAQAAPMAIRMFESNNWRVVTEANRFLYWLSEMVCNHMQWETMHVSLRRVTLADDVQRQIAALQLFMAGKLSGKTSLEALNYQWEQEQDRLADEAKIEMEIQQEQQETLDRLGLGQQIQSGVNPMVEQVNQQMAEQQGGAGGAVAGGMAGGVVSTPVSSYIQSTNPNTPVSPVELQETASSLAQELLYNTPESVKDSELRRLKQHNPTLHALVRQTMDSMRQQMRTQGGAMVQQQQAGG